MAGPVQSQPARAEVLNADWLSLRETKHADWLAGSRGGEDGGREREKELVYNGAGAKRGSRRWGGGGWGVGANLAIRQNSLLQTNHVQGKLN